MRLTKNELIKLLQAVENEKANYPTQRWGQLIMNEGWDLYKEVFNQATNGTDLDCFYNDSKIVSLFAAILDSEAKVYFLNSEFFKRLYK